MYLNRFQQGDEVSYAGNKEELRANLNGRCGTVVGRVTGEKTGVVVDFGPEPEAGCYILCEVNHLEKFVKRDRQPEAKGAEVKQRKPGGKPQGKGKPGHSGKRKNDQEAQ